MVHREGDHRGLRVERMTVRVLTIEALTIQPALGGLRLGAPNGSRVPLLNAKTSAETPFAPGTTQYKVALPGSVESVTVTAAAADAGATVAISLADADSNSANGHQVAFDPGQTRSIEVTVAGSLPSTHCSASWSGPGRRSGVCGFETEDSSSTWRGAASGSESG